MTRDCRPLGRGGSRYPNFADTSSHFLLPRFLGHVTGPKRLPDHSQSAALLVHVQWAPGCEAASCHSRVPH
ncbi:unnamed protein product [Staurois parvus]|uniref:Uncharacterized protein n=1 Tax=Staurois parvus TaxID=386267 RepID=A0ABN9BTL7_9NEOB|nr:unnamed protein product [Staurois parvus]